METEDTADDAALGSKILRSHLGNSTTLISAWAGVVTSLGFNLLNTAQHTAGHVISKVLCNLLVLQRGRDTAQPESGCIVGVTSWP